MKMSVNDRSVELQKQLASYARELENLLRDLALIFPAIRGDVEDCIASHVWVSDSTSGSTKLVTEIGVRVKAIHAAAELIRRKEQAHYAAERDANAAGLLAEFRGHPAPSPRVQMANTHSQDLREDMES